MTRSPEVRQPLPDNCLIPSQLKPTGLQPGWLQDSSMTQAFLRMSPDAADLTAQHSKILRPKVIMMTPPRGVDDVTCDRLEMRFLKSPLNRPHNDDLFPCYQKQANVRCKKALNARPPKS
jgi:hypothetical protein